MAIMQIREASQLSPAQKAAALMVAIGAKEASRVLSFLDEEEVELLAGEIVRLRHLPSSVLDEVIREFKEENGVLDAVVKGGVEYARELLNEWKGSKAQDIVDRVIGASLAQPFRFLIDVEPQQIVQYLQSEHPQTAALVLSYLHPTQAARVLSGLEPVLRAEVAMRIASMDRVSPEVVRQVEESLRNRMGAVSSPTEVSQKGGVKELAAILNSGDRTTERAILASFETYDPKLAEEVRALMFVFEDIVSLRDRDIQEALRNVDMGTLALALKGVNEQVRDAVLRNLSERARETLVEEMETLGAVRIREVEEAQSKVVAVIRRLDEEGKIVMRRDTEGGLVE